MSSVIFQTSDLTLATSDPPTTYDADEYLGTQWINISTQKQWFGSQNAFVGILPATTLPIMRLETGSLSEMLALQNPLIGQQFYLLLGDTTFSYNKLCVYSGRTWQVQGQTIEMCSDGILPIHNIVETDPDNDFTVRKCNISQDKDFIGVVAFSGSTSAGEWVTIAFSGVWDIAVEAGTHDRDDFILSDSTDGLCKTSASASTGCFGKCIESKTTTVDGQTVKAILHTVERF